MQLFAELPVKNYAQRDYSEKIISVHPFVALNDLWTVPCTQAHLEASLASAPVEIKIIARRFEFEPKTITVRKGQPVKL